MNKPQKDPKSMQRQRQADSDVLKTTYSTITHNFTLLGSCQSTVDFSIQIASLCTVLCVQLEQNT